jgi:hypothetical protein
MRRAARKDNIHGAVVNVWEQHGWKCLDLSRLGDGVPDILAVNRGFCVFIETQDPRWKSNKSPETLARQATFKADWGPKCLVLTISSVAQAWKEVADLAGVVTVSRL